MKTIYLVCADAENNHNKFWSGTAQDDGSLTVNWGRIGYQPQTKIHQCGSYLGALKKLEQLTSQKTKKGYQESSAQTENAGIPGIIKAKNLLEIIRQYVEKKDLWHPEYIRVLNEFLCIIPTPLPTKISPESVYRDVAQVDQQINLLKGLLGQKSDVSDEHNYPGRAAISLKSISKNFWRHLSADDC